MAESSANERNADPRRAVTRGTANVFADLALPDAIERQVRLRLAFTLNQLLAGRKLSPVAAVKVLGITPLEGAAHRLYKLAGFPVERLMKLLTALDQDVEIVIRRKPARGRRGGSASSRRSTSRRATVALNGPRFDMTDPIAHRPDYRCAGLR
jgi:predicted XRE-type DNA-binding protein